MPDWEKQRDISFPFTLKLENGEQLICERALRVLPGRRLVCAARQGDEWVLVKLFLGATGQREAQQDAAGVKALMAAGIATPALRLEQRVRDRRYPVLVFDYLADAASFRQVWTAAVEARQTVLLAELVAMVAALHQAGLQQRDFHLNNFLLDREGRLYAIDGGDYRKHQGPLNRRASIKALGLLFGHLPRRVLHVKQALLEEYCRLRQWPDPDRVCREVSRAADAFRHRRARLIGRKAFRNCSEFVARRHGRLRICQRRDLAADLLDGWMEETALAPFADERILKPGNSQTVWRSQLAGQPVVVKRYNLKNPVHALRRALSRSRAARSWENAHRLRAYHILTPQPLAMIEERRGWLRRRAWLITAEAPGAAAGRYIPEHHGEHDLRRLARVVLAFGDNDLVHGDMKATNFIMDNRQVQVIDLDSMRRPRIGRLRQAAIRADRERFLQNWQDALLRQRFRQLIERGKT